MSDDSSVDKKCESENDLSRTSDESHDADSPCDNELRHRKTNKNRDDDPPDSTENRSETKFYSCHLYFPSC